MIVQANRDLLAMIDSKALAGEVKRAQAARSEAEDAWCAVEELLWEMRHPRTWRRLAEIDAGVPQPLARAH